MAIALQEIVKLHDRLGRGREAEIYRKRILTFNGVEVDEERPSSGFSGIENEDNFPEINIEDLNISDCKDSTKSRPRRVNPKFGVKTNGLGDSRLHKAVQTPGKDGELISLLERGHPLEVVDNNGWTPLGEAVGYMNIEYVKILVGSYGANVNHKNHEGFTPFIQACSGGWLDGVEYLMETGAHVQLKNKKGVTGLAYLKDIIRQSENGETSITDSDQNRLDGLIIKLEETYTKLGLNVKDIVPHSVDEDSSSLGITDEVPDVHQTTFSSRKPPRETIFQRSPSSSPEPRNKFPRPRSLSKSPSPDSGTRQYKEAIDNLRGTSKRSGLQPLLGQENRSHPKKSSVPSDLSDWLEDDLGEVKKRKRSSDEFDAGSKPKGRQSLETPCQSFVDLTSDLSNRTTTDIKSRPKTNQLSRKSQFPAQDLAHLRPIQPQK